MNQQTIFQKNLRREVIELTLPVLAEQSFITLMGVINAIMAGHIGKDATAAIGMVDMLNNIFVAIFSALAVGGTVIVAQYTGGSNYRRANESAKQALWAGVILAALITVVLGLFRLPLLGILYGAADPQVLKYALSYLEITLMTYPLIAVTSIACGILRGAGDTKSPARIVILMNIINILSSYLLIFGFPFRLPFGIPAFTGLGVQGAALGIGVARLAGAVMLLYILVRGSLNLKIYRIDRFQPDWELLKAVLNIGIPASIESLFFNAGKLITQTFIVATGTVAIVSNYVAMSLHSLLIIPSNALSTVSTAIVGQYMGRSDRAGAKKVLFYINKLGTVGLVALNLLCFPLFSWFASLYTPDREVIRQVTRLLQFTTFFLVFWPISFVTPAGLKGAGDVRYTLAISAFSMWVFRISLGYILCINLRMGVLGVWLGMYTDWIIRGIAFTIRMKGEKWQKHIVIRSTGDVKSIAPKP